MNVIEFNKDLVIDESKNNVVVLADFQTFHLGEQELLLSAKRFAEKHNKKLIVLMESKYDFNNNDKAKFFTLESRKGLVKKYNPDYLVLFEPSSKNTKLKLDEIINIFINNLQATDIFITDRYSINDKYYFKDVQEELSKKFNLHLVKELEIKEGVIATTDLAKLMLEQRTFKSLKEVLGFNYFITGEITYEVQKGFELFDIVRDKEISTLEEGVYAAILTVDGEKFNSILYVDHLGEQKIHIIERGDKQFFHEDVYIELIETVRLKGELPENDIDWARNKDLEKVKKLISN